MPLLTFRDQFLVIFFIDALDINIYDFNHSQILNAVSKTKIKIIFWYHLFIFDRLMYQS